jgi:translocator assembly and maintenance protein 41
MAVPTDAFFESVISSLPPTEYAVAYGSGVFLQVGAPAAPAAPAHAAAEGDASAAAGNMVDFLLAVANSVDWHAANLRANPSHYSAIGLLGARAVASLQRAPLGGRVYFNAAVPHISDASGERRLIKYGVIETADLREDLREWSSLYISGRLHKPVRTLVPAGGDSPLAADLATNLRAGLAAGLLLLPARFSDAELFGSIAQISYSGDVRMGLAEDPRKVAKLVAPHLESFRALYQPQLRDARQSDAAGGRRLTRREDGGWEQGLGASCTAANLLALPPRVRARVLALAAPAAARCGGAGDDEAPRGQTARRLEEALARVPRAAVQRALSGCLAQTVRSASAFQSAKGLATAGLVKSAAYLLRKVRKARG